MARKKWPDEAPVFEDGTVGMRDVVLGVDINGDRIDTEWIASVRGHSVEISDNWSTPYFGNDSCSGLQFLRPLTPAARAMLAIAKAGGK